MDLSFSGEKNQNLRGRRLAEILLSNRIIATDSMGSNSLFNLKKISSEDASDLIEQYKKLRKACDQKAYSIKELDAIGEKITDAIAPAIRPIIKAVQSAATVAKPLSEDISSDTGRVVTNIIGKTSNILNESDRFCKIAKIYNPYINELNIAEKRLLFIAREEGLVANSLEELSYKLGLIKKEAGSVENSASNLASSVGKSLKGLGKGLGSATLRTLPFVGVATDSTLMCKNAYEAWINGTKIVSELQLNKYGISMSDAMIPTPGNTAKISKHLERLCNQYKDSPSNLAEILDISQTLKGYGTDFVSTIANLLMTILDISEFFGLGLLISFILSIPIIALEMANDSVVEEAYDKSINLIRSICDEKISGLGDIKFTDEEREIMRSFISNE
jgi:hypothetical protein